MHLRIQVMCHIPVEYARSASDWFEWRYDRSIEVFILFPSSNTSWGDINKSRMSSGDVPEFTGFTLFERTTGPLVDKTYV